MTDRPARWPDTPDIVTRLRSRREAWTCIREEAASEIEKLRAGLEDAFAQLKREAPVVNAAVLYCTTGQDRGGEKLLDAVAAYREMKNG
jgi:hypothetical protein